MNFSIHWLFYCPSKKWRKFVLTNWFPFAVLPTFSAASTQLWAKQQEDINFEKNCYSSSQYITFQIWQTKFGAKVLVSVTRESNFELSHSNENENQSNNFLQKTKCILLRALFCEKVILCSNFEQNFIKVRKKCV